MKCPRCGHEMTMDSHRKYALPMCYECGYIEGRDVEPIDEKQTNFERIKALNFNELVAFMSAELALDASTLADWLDDKAK